MPVADLAGTGPAGDHGGADLRLSGEFHTRPYLVGSTSAYTTNVFWLHPDGVGHNSTFEHRLAWQTASANEFPKTRLCDGDRSIQQVQCCLVEVKHIGWHYTKCRSLPENSKLPNTCVGARSLKDTLQNTQAAASIRDCTTSAAWSARTDYLFVCFRKRTEAVHGSIQPGQQRGGSRMLQRIKQVAEVSHVNALEDLLIRVAVCTRQRLESGKRNDVGHHCERPAATPIRWRP